MYGVVWWRMVVWSGVVEDGCMEWCGGGWLYGVVWWRMVVWSGVVEDGVKRSGVAEKRSGMMAREAC